MWFNVYRSFLSLLTLATLQSTVSSIDCYQCSGADPLHPFECDEPSTLKPLNCSSIYDAQFCIKHVGRFEGGIGMKRFCSSLDLGNYCNYVQTPGDVMAYRTCLYTCNTDGCNSSDRLKLFSASSLIVITFLPKLLCDPIIW